jgi:hypothetical protein
MRIKSNRGFVLITTMLMLAVLLSLLSAYFFTTNIEIGTGRMSKDSVNGFYAAEAGLNIRAETIRQTFVGFNRPAGTTPSSTNPCSGSNQGAGDYICRNFTLSKETAKTFIKEDPSNPVIITIPAGERYQNLNAQEYRYTAYSEAQNFIRRTTALLELRFKSRLVPLFQFAAFYNKDLEILPGPTMTLNGPVHTNGDLYLNTDNASPGLTIQGQVTTAGELYRGRKNTNVCNSNPVKIFDPLTARTLIPSCSSRVQVQDSQIQPYNNMIQTHVSSVEVPAPEVLDPTPGQVYWSHADLRLVLRLNGSGNPDTTNAATAIEARNADDSVDFTATNALNTDLVNCPGSISGRSIGNTNTFYNNREAKLIRMLDVDLTALLDCLKRTNWFTTAKRLDDDTDGGLVFHFTVKGPNSGIAANGYGVRVRNGQEIRSVVSGAPAIKGMTVVSDQAMYVMGTFNSVNKKPAAFLADTVNILSNAWADSNSYSGGAPRALSYRIATDTTVNSAFLAGTDTTGGVEGGGGQGGAYNGGLENYPRFHEDWTGRTFTYRGSFVSLNRPRHQNGVWVYGGNYYTAPNRVWSYETAYNNAANLPPITPRFVYLRQELFVRDFER